MRDSIADRIKNELPKPVANLIRTAGKAATEPGFKLYLVGGIVRDLLLGRQSQDIDIMVEGDALTIAVKMSAILESKPTVHKMFGTATFRTGDYRVDLATCRSETYKHPGALPVIKAGNIGQDLFRRDFTVNAMAACINPDHFGVLTDLYGGQQDLEKKIIRVLHERSFEDDATRIMRAVRYEQRLGFKLDNKTARLLRSNLDMLDSISGDRLRHEVILWLSEMHPEKILRRAARLGILEKLHPSLTWDRSMAKAYREAASTPVQSPTVNLHLALLVYNLDKEQLKNFLLRLNIRGGELEEIARHTAALKSNQPLFDYSPLQPSEIYLKLRGFNAVAVHANYLLTTSKHVRRNLRFYLDKLHSVRGRLNGKDLAEMGVPPGKKMGVILDRLLTARLDGEIKTRQDEEQMAVQLMQDLKSERM